ncbi:MATE family efflux transporter [Calderihabitans maritimus]|uniref:MATE efflux family protein n=1 Tax=Calderihabitans maritimus TaxID=1246530 RepID=A0A1Z5HVZ9_9FIRM|nr:MATE family efflux transporter [Calderihabitans maritimus]GAW93723.1 hypothetical protein STH872 [Calderihabitans maritimus]
MERSRAANFTEGSIGRQLIWFSVPMLLGNLLQALYNTVDSIWVGRFVGAEALGAVSVSFPVIFTLVSLITGIGVAATVLVSQYKGARQPDMVQKVVSNVLLILVTAGLAVSVLGILFHGYLLRIINTPVEIFVMTSSYLKVFLAGLVFMFLYNAISAVLRGLGDSRTPLIFLLYATLINIVLDPLFIFGLGIFPRLGVAGAALATDIAQATAALMSLRYLKNLGLLSFSFECFKLQWDLIKKILKIGLPAGVQHTIVSLGILALNAIINSFGEIIVAAYGAASRLDQFAFMPSMSISLAISAMVGQNLGAGKHERVREIVRWGILLSGGITFLVALVAVFSPRTLLALFTKEEEVLQAGALYLKVIGPSYVAFAVTFALQGVIRGAGDTLPSLIFSLIALWGIRVPGAALLSRLPALGVRGVWLAMAVSPVVGLLLHWGYYATGRWKTKVAVKQGPGIPEL